MTSVLLFYLKNWDKKIVTYVVVNVYCVFFTDCIGIFKNNTVVTLLTTASEYWYLKLGSTKLFFIVLTNNLKYRIQLAPVVKSQQTEISTIASIDVFRLGHFRQDFARPYEQQCQQHLSRARAPA
jgi:hypothetical protein